MRKILHNYKDITRHLIIMLVTLILLNSCTFNDFENKFQIHFIYVGQGDSILIKTSNYVTLIDAGPSINSKELVSYLKKQKIYKIDNLVLTHPHEDHFGGINDILKEFKVSNFFSPKAVSEEESYKYLLYNLKLHNLNIKTIKTGVSLNLGKDCKGLFLSPSKEYYDNLNNYSAVLRINYLNNSFLLCGDCEKEEEEEILNNYKNINSDVIKIGHHGSKTATSEEFIKRVSPHIAIISAGIRNKFSHPHQEVLKILEKHNIILFRTDISKTIIVNSDGNKISISTEIQN